MKILDKITNQYFPLTWANLEFYTESKGYKVEIYLTEDENLTDKLIIMFYKLFRSTIGNIKVYNPSWWDYCLDTWNAKEDRYDYDLEGKSDETKNYLRMLSESLIEIGYSGICKCNDWSKFLSITLNCIVTHMAPYSPVFYDEVYNFFFYFHHSGSIGLYYNEKNEVIEEILSTSKVVYDVK